MSHNQSLLAAWSGGLRPRILVLGDLMLDRYTWGDADRISPEAPVLVLRAEHEEVRLGGAASVASLLRSLEASVDLAGVVGNDAPGRTIERLLDEGGVGSALVVRDPSRPTTTKDRYMGEAVRRHAQQVMRVDRESREALTPQLAGQLATSILPRLDGYQALLISDYAKGVCTPDLLQAVIRAARQRRLPVLVDPARLADYQHYRGATIVTPNRLEAELATHRSIHTPDQAICAGHAICDRFGIDIALIKLDQEGIALVRREQTGGQVFATRPRQVYDVTGAGDMVLAMVGWCAAVGMPLDEGVRLANVAAGLEVEKLGVGSVSWKEIERELAQTFPCRRSRLQKHLTMDEAARIACAKRAAGQKIVFANGCFDLLHVGHVTYLEEAADLGDVLFVGMNSDASVRRLKGEHRPVIGEKDRIALLSALACVDFILVFDEDTPHELLQCIRPDVLVKGGTYAVEDIVGREFVEAYGGRVCVTNKVDGVSTTDILSSCPRNGPS